MAIEISQILDVLRAYGISPEENSVGTDLPPSPELELPEVGEIVEGETVYTTSISEVLGQHEMGDGSLSILDDPRTAEWWAETEEVIRAGVLQGPLAVPVGERPEPPEPHCAWYSPIHFFGHGWGIYIRESCVLALAVAIARFVDWRRVKLSPPAIAQQLLRSAFYVLFLHEQFHHKVESFGFRLLVATGGDRYLNYKSKVYRPSYLTSVCLEESLANAESYRRLGESRYAARVEPAVRDGLRAYLKASIPVQPPGYAEGVQYFSDLAYRKGLYELQSQIVDGSLPPVTPPGHWAIAPNVITSYADITSEIYVVLPLGARPIFRPTSVAPGFTVSSRALETALKKHHGYRPVSGGKGSHVKMAKSGAPVIVIPGNRSVLSPGVVKQALAAVGGYPLSKLPDLLEGRLRSRVGE